uniref:Genomic DNA, chromosome 3, clone:P0043E01 n=1 Tax=Oryza sativa subsp. japonica TaxID=39947 RepID=Q9SNK6_ORYSJ|nr:unnamed protein product [Oryza sativa Japonica Group]
MREQGSTRYVGQCDEAQAAVAEDVLTRMDAAEATGRATATLLARGMDGGRRRRRKQQDELRRLCSLAGWMGIDGGGEGGGGGGQTDEEGMDT